jgi:hypothetical protein
MTASTGELHTASGEWLSNVFLALAKFAVRRPKTRWVRWKTLTYARGTSGIGCIRFKHGRIRCISRLMIKQ